MMVLKQEVESAMYILKRVLIMIMMTLLLLELLLRLFDPFGIVYLRDISGVFDVANWDTDPYHLPEGEHTFHTFTATILPDHSRRVPDTPSQAACTLVAIGDSGTFGHGVQDGETWVNVLAQAFPDVRFVNTGLNGYNSSQVHQMQQQWTGTADGFIYRVDQNDIDPPYTRPRSKWMSYTSAYIIYLLTRQQTAQAEQAVVLPDGFIADVLAIDNTAPTLFFAEDTALSHALQAHLPTLLIISPYTHHNSVADPHPDTAGHQEIAAALLPYVQAAIDAWCPSP